MRMILYYNLKEKVPTASAPEKRRKAT